MWPPQLALLLSPDGQKQIPPFFLFPVSTAFLLLSTLLSVSGTHL